MRPLPRPALRLARSVRLARPSLPGNHRLLALAGVLAALVGGFLMLRESSLVEVREVTVSGASGRDADAVRAALASAARGQSTLAVDREALVTAVAPYPIVKDIEVATDFPHGMDIRVVEHELVGAVKADGRTVPVAEDGTVLRGTSAKDLPVIPMRNAPAGARIERGPAAALVGALAAAPAALRERIASVGAGESGVTMRLDTGVEIVLGRPERLVAKWAAAARVLADPTAQGTTYVDVRLPERPAAGGLEQIAIQQQATEAAGATSAEGAVSGEPVAP